MGQLRERIDGLAAGWLPSNAFPMAIAAARGTNQYFRRRGLADPLWGFVELEEHESAILETPLLLRLHHIKQTAFSFHAFPGATHNRYLHSVGVLHQAEMMLRSLDKRLPSGQRVTDAERRMVRLAALLHDVGHGPYSHSSESFYRSFPDLDELRHELSEELSISFDKAGYAESLSVGLLLSPAFVTFMSVCEQVLSERHGPVELTGLLPDVARLIFGCEPRHGRPWLRHIVSGNLDADKLDYLHRDGMHAGLETSVDLSRLYSSLRIENADFMVLRDGLGAIADLAENRFTLNTLMYSEPKSRIADCMFHRALAVACRERPVSTDFFLEKDDVSVLSWLESAANSVPRDLARRVKAGPLYAVAFTISCPLVVKACRERVPEMTEDRALAIMSSWRRPEIALEWEARIARRAACLREEQGAAGVSMLSGEEVEFGPDFVIVDLPKALSFQGLGLEKVILHGDWVDESMVTTVAELLSLDARAEEYRRKLWRGYVITHPDWTRYVRQAFVETLCELAT